MPDKQPTSMRMDPELKAALMRAALDDERSVTQMIDRILRTWLAAKGYLKPREAPKKT